MGQQTTAMVGADCGRPRARAARSFFLPHRVGGHHFHLASLLALSIFNIYFYSFFFSSSSSFSFMFIFSLVSTLVVVLLLYFLVVWVCCCSHVFSIFYSFLL
jgi:hypothetical protein